MPEATRQRPGPMGLKGAITYGHPLAAIVSILHRASGIGLFLFMPFLIWMFDTSVTSEVSYARFTHLFDAGTGVLGGWFYKLIVLGLIWAYLHHLIAGLRHVWMDVSHAAVSKQFGSASGKATLAVSLVLTVVLGAKLFGLY